MKYAIFSLIIFCQVPCFLQGKESQFLAVTIIEDPAEEKFQPTIVKDVMRVDPRDIILEKKVKNKLGSGMLSYKFADVQSKVVNGSVILNGTVRSATDKLEAETRVKEVPGVKSVINRIEVTSTNIPIY